MSTDLAMIAERRAGLAALLGTLLLEEPGPGLGDLVDAVPGLAALAGGDDAVRSEYERVFLRGVPLYASAFLDDDGQVGGPTLGAVIERYDRLEYTEHRDRRWRGAGADHLGLLLRCHAQLCHREADGWRQDRPDVAAGLIEAERALLHHHISSWAPVALEAVAQLAADGPYGAVVEAVTALLGEEHDRLRPAPAIGAAIAITSRPQHLGPARLARLLLAPATCGTWLSTAVMAAASCSIGSPWRRSDTRSRLRHVIDTAHDSGDLSVVLGPVLDAVRAAGHAHEQRAAADPGNAAHAHAWAARAAATVTMLEGIVLAGDLRHRDEATHETITVSSADGARLADVVDRVVDELRAAGCTVARITASAPMV